MSKFKSNVSLFLACILAAFAILVLIIIVPGLLVGASTLKLIGIVIVVIVVVLFAVAIILKGLACLLEGFKA